MEIEETNKDKLFFQRRKFHVISLFYFKTSVPKHQFLFPEQDLDIKIY